MSKYLYENYAKNYDLNCDIITTNLNPKITLRDYQKNAFMNYINYYEAFKKQIHLAFHMATGSGKTIIMAGLILYHYKKGYKKFIFFVNQTNIIEKTKDNFTNKLSSKYLFNDTLKCDGNEFDIKIVDNFSNNDDLEIIFITVQGFYSNLQNPKENLLSKEDFKEHKVVFISDESHHLNANTKNFNEEENNWENSVLSAFYENKENILLEFSATFELNNNHVKNKYKDKIIFSYPLIDFRNSAYTKEFHNFASDTELFERSLIALVMSEYRRFLFAELDLNVKPVVMLKSKEVKNSKCFYEEFFQKLKELNADDINKLQRFNIDELNKAILYFKDKDESLENLKNYIKASFKKEYAILINSKDIDKNEQLMLNSLEDDNNPIRLIFAVDMLNEGWDVLNLYDIVRLYDTRQGGNKISSYTIKEAQLIGRAARYYPFKYNDFDNNKRKFDEDITNKYRILETMYFHSKNDSKYISELKQALIATGLADENAVELEYILKSSFKESDFFKETYVLRNKREPKPRAFIDKIEDKIKCKKYIHTLKTNEANIDDLFSKRIDKSLSKQLKSIKLKEIDYHIIQGAFDRFLSFKQIKNKYPKVKTYKDFLVSDDYLGEIIIEFEFIVGDEIKGIDYYNACLKIANDIKNHIFSLKDEFEGSKDFYPIQLSKVLKDKKVKYFNISNNGGKGESQNNCSNNELKYDLSDKDWYVYNDNYGTSEEKEFVRTFASRVADKLRAKNLEYYLIRNERIPELAIYSYNNGERFEPDFLLLIKKNNALSNNNYQTFIEPKGEHLIDIDKWKEDFLISINIKRYSDLPNEYQVIGLPFYNHKDNKDFLKKIEEWIGNI